MTELVTINGLARHFNVDPKTVSYWAGREWFPEPVQRSTGRGRPTLYDLDAVRRARTAYTRRRPTNPKTGRRRSA